MKRYIYIICFVAMGFGLNAQNLQSALNYCTFTRPDGKPYVETYLMVRGETAKFLKNANGKYQGNVEVVLTATRNDTVFYADKYNLLSPEIDDTAGAIPNFIDKHNLPLPNGNYSLELSIADLNRTAPSFKGAIPVTVAFPDTGVTMSDIMPVESYVKAATPTALTKSGFDIVPYVSSYYPETVTELSFYTEVYNTDKKFGVGEKFVVYYFIESADTKKPLDTHFKTKVYTTQQVTPVLSSFDISKLPSGNYYLVVDVRDKNNFIVGGKKIYFQRSSGIAPITDMASINAFANNFDGYLDKLPKDTLLDFVRSLRPIAGPKERQYIDANAKKADSTALRTFFKAFWEAKTPDNAFKGWAEYLALLRVANREFGTSIRRGYMTDRGRVFLQYGPPNTRTVSPREPSAYPYEIWQYYTLGKQNNRRFVFYLPDLVTNDYTLLHSDALGEITDDQWQLKLHKRDTQSNNFDIRSVNPTYGGRADDFFNNPR
jgi:GWxTD domain-containing protein